MSSKMKLSTQATKDLEEISVVLDLKRNVVCRMALGVSLSYDNPPSLDDMDYGGQEFNKSTIVGVDEAVLTALLTHHFNCRIDPEDFFSKYMRAEIIRGLDEMVKRYHKINSPEDFMKSLCDLE